MLSRFLGWALFPLYVYQLPSPADYGIVTNLYAWVALLLILLTYGMETGFFRFSREGDGRKVYANSLRTLGTSSLLFLILGLLFVKPIGAALGYADMLRPVAMLIVIVAIDAFTSIPFAYLRYTNQALRYGLIKIGYVLLTVALNLFFLLVCPWLQRVAPGAVDWWYEPGLGVEYIFLSNMIANIILLLVLIPIMKQARGGGRFDWELLRRMLHYSLPMVLLGIAGNFNKMADKIIFPMLFEDQTFANTQLGIYSAGYKIAVVIVMFTQAFRFAYEPFIFQRGKEGELSADEEAAAERERRITYAKAMHYYLLSAIFIYVAVMCYLDLLKVLISPAYYDGLRVVPYVMLGEVLFGIYYNLSLWYALGLYGVCLRLGGEQPPTGPRLLLPRAQVLPRAIPIGSDGRLFRRGSHRRGTRLVDLWRDACDVDASATQHRGLSRTDCLHRLARTTSQGVCPDLAPSAPQSGSIKARKVIERRLNRYIKAVEPSLFAV